MTQAPPPPLTEADVPSLGVVEDALAHEDATWRERANNLDTKAGILLSGAGVIVALVGTTTSVAALIGQILAVAAGVASVGALWPRVDKTISPGAPPVGVAHHNRRPALPARPARRPDPCTRTTGTSPARSAGTTKIGPADTPRTENVSTDPGQRQLPGPAGGTLIPALLLLCLRQELPMTLYTLRSTTPARAAVSRHATLAEARDQVDLEQLAHQLNRAHAAEYQVRLLITADDDEQTAGPLVAEVLFNVPAN